MAIPSLSELIVPKSLWRRQPPSAREIHRLVAPELGCSCASPGKTLERMLGKGSL